MQNSQPGLTRAQVQQIVLDYIAGVPEAGPSQEEIQRISEGVAESVVARIPPRSDPAAYTRFFVQNAISRYESDGLAATLAHYNREESVDGQWHLFIVDENDLVIGHYEAHLRGLDLKGCLGTDANGYNFGPNLLAAPPEGRWVSYVFRNPQTAAPNPDHTGALVLQRRYLNLVSFRLDIASRKARPQSYRARGQVAVKGTQDPFLAIRRCNTKPKPR